MCYMQLMSSIKTVLIEMLSQFEAKGKLGAKVIREQLHSAWPVPGSRSSHDQLRRELLEQLKQDLEVVSSPSFFSSVNLLCVCIVCVLCMYCMCALCVCVCVR